MQCHTSKPPSVSEHLHPLRFYFAKATYFTNKPACEAQVVRSRSRHVIKNWFSCNAFAAMHSNTSHSTLRELRWLTLAPTLLLSVSRKAFLVTLSIPATKPIVAQRPRQHHHRFPCRSAGAIFKNQNDLLSEDNVAFKNRLP